MCTSTPPSSVAAVLIEMVRRAGGTFFVASIAFTKRLSNVCCNCTGSLRVAGSGTLVFPDYVIKYVADFRQRFIAFREQQLSGLRVGENCRQRLRQLVRQPAGKLA
jgi:hypothetical protein